MTVPVKVIQVIKVSFYFLAGSMQNCSWWSNNNAISSCPCYTCDWGTGGGGCCNACSLYWIPGGQTILRGISHRWVIHRNIEKQIKSWPSAFDRCGLLFYSRQSTPLRHGSLTPRLLFGVFFIISSGIITMDGTYADLSNYLGWVW